MRWLILALAFLAVPAFAQNVQIPPPGAGQYPGTVTNNNANAGNVGEYQTASISAGSAISLTTSTPATIVSQSLTAGDWDVACNFNFLGASSPVINILEGAPSGTTNALPAAPAEGLSAIQFSASVSGPGVNTYLTTGPARFSLSTTTTVFCVAEAIWTTGTVSAYGLIRARRIR